MRETINAVNLRIASWGTRRFGTMACTYLFAFYGLLGAIPALVKYQPVMLFWSNWVQLWALPLLLVGASVISAESDNRQAAHREEIERQRQEDHEAIIQMLAEIRGLECAHPNAKAALSVSSTFDLTDYENCKEAARQKSEKPQCA